jgi:hypothetical protein
MANEENNFENDDISRVLGSLKRVDAPGDFDVRVRARIAQGRPAAGRSWFPVPAGVAATVLVVAAAGYFGFRSYYPPAVVQEASVVTAPQVADQTLAKQQEPQADRRVEPGKEQANDAIAVKPPDMQPTIPAGLAPTSQPKAADKEPGGGSFDITRGIPKVITPKGVNPDSRLSPNQILSGLGAEANYNGVSWSVSEVKRNSLAERSGLKAGDVIEAVNNQPLTKRTSFPNSFAGRTISVRREGKVIEIALQP